MALKLLIALGLLIPNIYFAEDEVAYRDDPDKRDYNRSTTTVNRSSDVRPNRTMDTRPSMDEYMDTIDSSNPYTRGEKSTGN